MSILISRRFRGPSESANGGYACGSVARLIEGPAEVTLRLPPPLELPLDVERRADGGVVVRQGGAVVAEGAPRTLQVEVPPPVSFAEAQAASARYAALANHVFPGCFVCGPERSLGDGLRIFAGPVEGRGVVASPWVPDASLCDERGEVLPEVVWAALDCPSYFGISAGLGEMPMALLGRLAAKLLGPVQRDERYVVLGWHRGGEGRKLHGGAAVYSADGELRAFSGATWITAP